MKDFKTMDTELVTKAFLFATRAHQDQKVKGSEIPYISHPMHVASVIWEFGGTPEQVAAGLLHDVVEDTHVTLTELRGEFGDEVAGMVLDCTDAQTAPKPPWRPRKEAYIAHLRNESRPDSLLVSLADKHHNVNRILTDLRYLEGREEQLWSLFNAPPDQIVWYYSQLLLAFMSRYDAFTPDEKARWPKLTSLLGRFQRSVRELESAVTSTHRG